MNPKIDDFLARTEQWNDEFVALRAIILDCRLEEDLKWGQPCYSIDGKNVLLIHGFKEYCAILFMKGALMKDPEKILITQTANVQASRQIRFTGLKHIVGREAILKEYIKDAIELEKSGAKVAFKETKEFAVPEELRQKFAADPGFDAAFHALTPGRQRAYLLHFGEPKQAKTREARIEKYAPRILDGLGLND